MKSKTGSLDSWLVCLKGGCCIGVPGAGAELDCSTESSDSSEAASDTYMQKAPMQPLRGLAHFSQADPMPCLTAGTDVQGSSHSPAKLLHMQ